MVFARSDLPLPLGVPLALHYLSRQFYHESQRIRVADVNSFNNSVITSFALKVLLVLRLRAIWNKDLIGT